MAYLVDGNNFLGFAHPGVEEPVVLHVVDDLVGIGALRVDDAQGN